MREKERGGEVEIVPNISIVQENNKLALIRINGLSMSIIEKSSMTHQKMREVTTLSCNKNLTKQTYCVVQCC